MRPLTSAAARVVRSLRGSLGDADDAVVLAEVRDQPDPAAILEELSRHDDLEVRGWVPGAAADILGHDGVPLIKRLTHDRDADIRDLAYQALERIDPKLLDPLLRTFRRRLSSRDPDEVIRSGWTLAARGDTDAIPALEAFRDRYEPWEAYHKMAAVILLVLTAPEEVARLIRAHDHERVGWLAYAATKVADPEAIAALRECSESAPDDECRKACSWGLERAGAKVIT